MKKNVIHDSIINGFRGIIRDLVDRNIRDDIRRSNIDCDVWGVIDDLVLKTVSIPINDFLQEQYKNQLAHRAEIDMRYAGMFESANWFSAMRQHIWEQRQAYKIGAVNALSILVISNELKTDKMGTEKDMDPEMETDMGADLDSQIDMDVGTDLDTEP